MQEVKSVRSAEVAGKRVLLRADFNVPLQDGAVADDTRIKAVLPTIEFLLSKNAARIEILTHLGRPEGKAVDQLRVAPVAKKLRSYISAPNIIVHENVRFDAREEKNDPAYAQELAALGDIFVSDAFAVAHRTSSSVVGIAKFLPSYAGLLMEKEIKALSGALTPPQGAVAIIGGAKGETKIPVIEKFSKLYSKVLVGGAIALEYKPQSVNVLVPGDGVPQLEGMLDVGPETSAAWAVEVSRAPFVLWNGPLGFYEKGYSAATDTIAETIVSGNVSAIIGGGNTIAAISKTSFDASRVFISTGGGAMLEFLLNGTLPGIEALKR